MSTGIAKIKTNFFKRPYRLFPDKAISNSERKVNPVGGRSSRMGGSPSCLPSLSSLRFFSLEGSSPSPPATVTQACPHHHHHRTPRPFSFQPGAQWMRSLCPGSHPCRPLWARPVLPKSKASCRGVELLHISFVDKMMTIRLITVMSWSLSIYTSPC